MTFQLDWPADVVARISEQARQEGISLGDYVLQSLTQNKRFSEPWNDAEDSKSAAKSQAREHAGRNIRALREGNNLGPDLTIRDLVEEGRRS